MSVKVSYSPVIVKPSASLQEDQLPLGKDAKVQMYVRVILEDAEAKKQERKGTAKDEAYQERFCSTGRGSPKSGAPSPCSTVSPIQGSSAERYFFNESPCNRY